MRTVIYRILGNDLPPRHDPNQTPDNLKFFIEHESQLRDCERRFCLNRILDPDRERVLQRILQDAGFKFFTIPVCRDTYGSLSGERERLSYLTNVNSARNQCIVAGLQDADWVFPLDGGTFVRAREWVWVQERVYENGLGVIAVPTWRAASYEAALTMSSPDLTEKYVFGGGRSIIGPREMSLGFSRIADVRFDPCRCYGEVDKAELLWRLGIRGAWDMWNPEIRVRSLKRPSRFSGKVPIGGAVCRLPAGNQGVEGTNHVRGAARRAGMLNLLRRAKIYLGAGK
jgi:hypothetical protein